MIQIVWCLQLNHLSGVVVDLEKSPIVCLSVVFGNCKLKEYFGYNYRTVYVSVVDEVGNFTILSSNLLMKKSKSFRYISTYLVSGNIRNNCISR